ncbi:MAG: HAD-IIIA family hydrolase [Acidobacteriota bacterium]|nr:MAG: HAD-IIIA family hydrolase [Acidobacteriota bacterium]
MANIKLLLMDCDGVLTDGRLYYSSSGEELKAFHVRDGHAIVEWHRAGNRSGIISGRSSKAVEARARELGIEFVYQGVTDKVAALNEILKAAGVDASEAAFIGDDIPDIKVMEAVGFSVAVGDAAADVKQIADLVTEAVGGRGAVREAVEHLLKKDQ